MNYDRSTMKVFLSYFKPHLGLFVLDLSFIGWQILSGLTFGILGIFYVNPYIYATKAELYLALKRD